MKIAILGLWNYSALCAAMEDFIKEKQCYLFTVVCGGTNEEGIKDSIGYKWAYENGAPVRFLIEKDVEKLIDKLSSEIDYVIIMNNGEQIIKRIIMKMRMMGKHGKVVNMA